jgi:ParB family transcriptional regulator, chromosome partitioning protein
MRNATVDPPKRRALGKGLESLLPRISAVAEERPTSDPAVAGAPGEIPLDAIDRNPFQTRTHFEPGALAELSASIAANGVVQPILVRAMPNGRFQLIAGERRFLASKGAGKTTIPALVRQVSDEQALEITIVENLQRTDLNPMEQARAYERLAREFKLTQEQMAQRTGKDRASVANFLRLLWLPPEIQAKIEGGELTFGHARALLPLENPEITLKAAQKVAALSMSVRQTENYVQGMLDPEGRKAEKKLKEPLDPNVREARDLLQRALGLKVTILDRRGRGRVIIEYTSLSDFDSLLETVESMRRA